MAKSAWYEDWFDRDYVLLYGHRDGRDAEAGVSLACELLRPPPGARLADLGCGAGRHALEFIRRGLHVVGVDLSRELLGLARDAASAGSCDLPLVRADLRRLPFAGSFDLAVSFFTSFGYFKSRDDDATALRSMVACVKLDGGFLLDLMNPAQVRKNLDPLSQGPCGDGEFVAQRRIEGDRVVKTITISRPEGRRTVTESVRLYDQPGIATLAAAAGLGQLGWRGGYDGQAFANESPRLILVGRRER